MNKNDELTGTFVLVHPHLICDPESRQGQMGFISTAELENDNVMVNFGKDGQLRLDHDDLDALLAGRLTDMLRLEGLTFDDMKIEQLDAKRSLERIADGTVACCCTR